MRRMCLLGALMLVVATAVSSCYALAYAYIYTVALFDPHAFEGWGAASGGTPGVRAIITDVRVEPAEVHVGQAALLDYTLGTVSFDGPEGSGGPIKPSLDSTAGQLLPLLPQVYTPGGSVPDAATAQAALAAYSQPYALSGALDSATRANGHIYLLFVAPSTAGPVTVTLAAGAPRPPLPQEATRQIVINVLP